MKTHMATLLVGTWMGATPAMAQAISPEDRAAIVAATVAIAQGADRHDWPRVRAALADEVDVDYTSLAGGEPARVKADDLVHSWSEFLPGFEATQHLVTNHTITPTGANAVAVLADFQATHRIGTALWTLGGFYDYALSRGAGGWQVTAMKMTWTWESGDRDLTSQAAERAKAAP